MGKVTKPRSAFREYIVKNDNDEDICKFFSTKFGKNIIRIKDHFIVKTNKSMTLKLNLNMNLKKKNMMKIILTLDLLIFN